MSRTFMRYISCILLLMSLQACAASLLGDDWLSPRPLGKDLTTFKPARLSEMDVPVEEQSLAPPAALKEPEGELRLRDALALALLHSPELAAVAYDVRAAEARAIQAGLIPNPSVELMAERFGSTKSGGAFRGFDGAETTVRFSQLVELGGKLPRRVALARADQRLAAWDYEARRLALFTQTTQRFIEVLAAQQRVTLAQDNLKLAEQTAAITEERITNGVAAPVEREKAKVVLSTERITLARSQRQLASARHQLAATWGGASPRFSATAGALDDAIALAPLPSQDDLAKAARLHPSIARWDDELAKRRAAVDVARAKAVPDVTLSAGVMRMFADDETVFLAQAMIPLPLFDRNQGGILEAVYEVGKAKQSQRAAEAALLAELAKAYHELEATREESRLLREETLPAAKASLTAMQDAFRAGKVTYLEVLDAQRTYVEVQRQLVDAQAAMHSGAAMIEGLTGRPLGGGR